LLGLRLKLSGGLCISLILAKFLTLESKNETSI
jgi:hypothetical protein